MSLILNIFGSDVRIFPNHKPPVYFSHSGRMTWLKSISKKTNKQTKGISNGFLIPSSDTGIRITISKLAVQWLELAL